MIWLFPPNYFFFLHLRSSNGGSFALAWNISSESWLIFLVAKFSLGVKLLQSGLAINSLTGCFSVLTILQWLLAIMCRNLCRLMKFYAVFYFIAGAIARVAIFFRPILVHENDYFVEFLRFIVKLNLEY